MALAETIAPEIDEEVRFNMDLTQPQSDFFNSKAKYTAAVAGFGSGKTDVAFTRMLANMMEQPGLDQAYLAPTYPLIRDIWYPKVEERLDEMNYSYDINKSAHVITIHGLGKIYCRTMERPESIVGWQVGDAFLDEFDVLATDKAIHVFRKISARLRQKKNGNEINRLYITTTPEGFKATYKLFKKEPLSGSNLIQMSTYSNAHNLPPDYIQGLRDQYPSQLIEAYLNGLFVNLTSGTVYYNFSRETCNTKYVARPKEQLHVGMDFNVYNMAAIIHVIREGNAYAVDEIVGARDTPDVIEIIKERYPDRNVKVYPDASGDSVSSKSATTSDFSLLKEAGFQVKSHKANPAIKNRVQAVNKRFELDRYHVNVERCPQYTESLEQQVYNEVTGLPDKTNGLDHPVDAGGYFINYMWPIRRRGFLKKTIGG